MEITCGSYESFKSCVLKSISPIRQYNRVKSSETFLEPLHFITFYWLQFTPNFGANSDEHSAWPAFVLKLTSKIYLLVK